MKPETMFPELLTPGEVAKLFRVDPKTITRWARDGRLPSVFTMGGHRRYRRDAIEKYLAEQDGSRGTPNPRLTGYRGPERSRRQP